MSSPFHPNKSRSSKADRPDAAARVASLSACRKRPVEADPEGGHVSSNGGAVLLRQVDRRLGLTAAVARKLDDTRQPGKVRQRLQDMVRQRRTVGLPALVRR